MWSTRSAARSASSTEDDEELQGGAEIAERDTHRWELDPSSKDDFDDEK